MYNINAQSSSEVYASQNSRVDLLIPPRITFNSLEVKTVQLQAWDCAHFYLKPVHSRVSGASISSTRNYVRHSIIGLTLDDKILNFELEPTGIQCGL